MNDWNIETQEIIKFARQQELKVLIWGPGDPGESGSPEAKKGYGKRCQIRDELKRKFPRSRIDFSEDIRIDGIKGQFPKQLLEAEIANLVIILDISPGAHVERDVFTKHSWFRNKVWLLVKQEHINTKGLVGEVFKLIPQDQIQGFTDEEFHRCDVAKIMSVDIVTTAAVRKLLDT